MGTQAHVKIEEEAEAQRASLSDSVTPGSVMLGSYSQPPCDLQEAPSIISPWIWPHILMLFLAGNSSLLW